MSQPSTMSDPDGPAAMLKAAGLLNEQQYQLVLRRCQSHNTPEHRAAVDLSFVSEEDAWHALAEHRRMEYVPIEDIHVERNVLESIPLKLILHYKMVPLDRTEGRIRMAFGEPPSRQNLGSLQLLLGSSINPVLATPSALNQIIRQHFGLGAESVQKLGEDSEFEDAGGEAVFDVTEKKDDEEFINTTIATFVDQILAEALKMRATDVHIEPYKSSIRLRYRVDGIMQTVPVPPNVRQLHSAIVSRIKVMAALNIAEKRLPHDGRIAMKTGNEEYDLRVSVMPTKHGEAVCLRILGRQSLYLDLSELGLEPEQEKLYTQLTRLPQGLILVTGPTGSGKTTSLYAGLAKANDATRKTITIEDPVEYQLPGATQIQVHPEIGLSFARGLRSILRHDPDIVLVGEIRDAETAEIAVRAAQTGHLVFSTLHTNDSASAVIRLIEMGIDPFLVSSSLVCSMAQRLLRRNCPHCSEPDTHASEALRKELAGYFDIDPQSFQPMKGTGCEACNDTGYQGRVAIYEFFLVDDEIADLIEPGVKTGTLRRTSREHGQWDLRKSAFNKVLKGVSSFDEADRITRRVDLVS